jgi:hypothetical protein
MEPILADWRKRWPAVFTTPVPLAIGISRHMKQALRDEGVAVDRRALGIVLHHWTIQGTYLRAVARG